MVAAALNAAEVQRQRSMDSDNGVNRQRSMDSDISSFLQRHGSKASGSTGTGSTAVESVSSAEIGEAIAGGLPEAGYKKIEVFLKKHGFKGDVNTKRSSLFKHTYPLHVAVKEQDVKMVRLLILAGADTSLKNSSKFTPVQKAWKYRVQKEDRTSKKVLCALGEGNQSRDALSSLFENAELIELGLSK